MSISIHTGQTGGTSASEASRSDSVRLSTNGAAGKAGSRSGSEDRVELSSFSEKIAAASSSESTQQSARVRQLAALYQSGRYKVDSHQVSRALVSQALSAGPAESEH